MTTDPWDRIRKPENGYAWLLRKSAGSRTSHFGMNSDGAACFMIEASSDFSDVVSKTPALAGVDVDFRKFGAAGPFGMTLELRQNADRSLFLLLCEDVARVAEAPDSEAQGFLSAVNRLIRWQRLLARDRSSHLSPEEVRGLYAELVVMSKLWTNSPGNEDFIVRCWDGPAGASQDFRFTSFCLEVKATTPDRNGLVRISSEEQFNRSGRDIYLAVVRLRDVDDASDALSLNDLVTALLERLDERLHELLEEKLVQAGYLDLDVYSSPRFLASEPDLYAISAEAPVLHRENIPPSISNLRYELDTRQLSEHRVTQLPEVD
jgi:hypothetical protein